MGSVLGPGTFACCGHSQKKEKESKELKEISKANLTSATLGFSLTSCREFFGQGWMKLEKNERTPYIMKTTKHFNDVSMGVGEGEGQCLSLRVSLGQDSQKGLFA